MCTVNNRGILALYVIALTFYRFRKHYIVLSAIALDRTERDLLIVITHTLSVGSGTGLGFSDQFESFPTAVNYTHSLDNVFIYFILFAQPTIDRGCS